jgi:hypothetical protein
MKSSIAFCIASALATGLWMTGGSTAHAEPTLYVESVVGPPVKGPIKFDETQGIEVNIYANKEVQNVTGICMSLVPKPMTPDAPIDVGVLLPCIEYFNFDGPGSIMKFRFYFPEDTPENAFYELDLIPEPIWQGKFKIVNGYATVRNKPFLKGDLVDDGAGRVSDAIRSLRLTVGLEAPTPYERAAGDYNRDGQLTLADTVLILRRWVFGPV